ncbi:Purple acid phosphatase 8 [Apostasia shenzhenica]|uniref:Purple acid phosphatase n=1 Tax=Apostasia shenzhenica TaxID=1088818 RepID=A0A2I0B4P7_9ASPA|nr:Purple acid phosphatase 8 [Apostasia shenzhenica]
MASALALVSSSLFLTFLSSSSSSSSAELLRFEHPTKHDGSLSLIVVGDWGRKGECNQSQVAKQTAWPESKTRPSRSPSPTSTRPRVFRSNVLGNHDYRGDVLAQLSPVLRKIDSRWLCLRSFILQTEIADFFFVDTTPFVLKYWRRPKDHHYDWREVSPRNQYINTLLQDLDGALKESIAPWKFVVGHHTMRSVSKHGDTEELLEKLLPVLKEHGVDIYINGHDHCLEHISSKDSSIQYLTSGGGSNAWRGTYTPNDDELQFFYDGQGFMAMEVMAASVKIKFYDVFGQVQRAEFNKALRYVYQAKNREMRISRVEEKEKGRNAEDRQIGRVRR